MQNQTTEQHNPLSAEVDTLSALGIVELMNSQDAGVATAVGKEKHVIASAIEIIVRQFGIGGRLFYIGAGTSGRLGVLDASECPPTFNTPPGLVIGVIAGGTLALTNAMEGAEDIANQGPVDLQTHNFCQRDVLVGIATSGQTPYVVGAIDYARSLGAATIGLTCNENSSIHKSADLTIAPIVGPEIISGSTRLKSGTATKMVLNMLTTAAMVLLGKTYGNRMVDLRVSNEKLKIRSVRMVSELTGLGSEQAESILGQCAGEVKTAIVAHVADINAADARARLIRVDGQLRAALSMDSGNQGESDLQKNHSKDQTR